MSTNEATEDKVREKVRTGYANIAKKGIFRALCVPSTVVSARVIPLGDGCLS